MGTILPDAFPRLCDSVRRSRGPSTLRSVLLALVAGCSIDLHEPAIDHEMTAWDEPWRIHCETARTHEAHTDGVPDAARTDWLFAMDEDGRPFTFEGRVVDGFFEVAAVRSGTGETLTASRIAVRRLCLDTVAQVEGDDELMLGWVMAARPDEEPEKGQCECRRSKFGTLRLQFVLDQGPPVFVRAAPSETG